MLNNQGLQVVSAYAGPDGRWLGSEPVADNTNEIPAAQALLRRVGLEGALLTANALHTQTEKARSIVQERGADYLFTVKGNQPGFARNVQQWYRSRSHAFPLPVKTTAAQTYERNRGRLEARCLILSGATAEAVAVPFVTQAARLTHCFDSAKRPAAQIDTEYRLCSRPGTALETQSMLEAERGHWGI